MRNKSSPVWDFFTVIDKTNAKCNMCKLQMSYKSSITNLKKHIERKHPTVKIIQKSATLESATDEVEHMEHDGEPGEQLNVIGDGSSASASGENENKSVSAEPSVKKSRAVQKRIESLSNKMSSRSKKSIDSDLLLMLTLDFQPFSIVEDKGFQKFVHALNPSYKLPTRQTVSKTLIPAL